ncbi:uncharacterized protein LOC132784994 [Drosophila nasuta]|uniref:uncharacterized protein LOC132784994 n=1 Tax=Drosophila nasuta TaxID=42062 RepID=UPI00295E528A|nr:uncharacterized protein LOC132784994 [Drosophila nasuta]
MDTDSNPTLQLTVVESDPDAKSTGSVAKPSELLEQSSDAVNTADAPTEDAPNDTDEEAAAKAAARKARLKQARSIRFTIGDSQPDIQDKIPENEKKTSFLPLDEQSDDVVTTAISTPTRYVGEGSFELEELTLPELEIEEDVDKLLGLDTEEDDGTEEERSSIKGGDSINAKKYFLEHFEIPGLEDISDDEIDSITERLKSLISMERSSSHVGEDIGKFVDPLTGESISSSSSSSSSEPVVMSSISSSSGDAFELKSMQDFKMDAAKAEVDEDLYSKFKSSFVASVEPVEIADFGLIKAKMLITQVAADFLNDLIRNVVITAEQIREDLKFNKSINKWKLHNHLSDIVRKYTIEKDINAYLNSRMSEYHKRAKNLRVFMKLPLELHEKERERYREAITKLDFNLILMAEAKKKSSYLLPSVMMDLSYFESICRHSEQVLNDRMLDTLGRNSEYLRKVTERELRLMSQKRNEISDIRLSLLTRTHTLGRITDKIHKLEQINEDISMDDFITLQNQVAALNKKIEERNLDLKKARGIYHSALHMAQHNREKIQSLTNKLLSRKAHLTRVQDRQRVLREKLYVGKMERQRIRKINSDLTYQGGLLALPSLMYDYDETMERIEVRQAKVDELKEMHTRISNRIAEFELIVGKANSISTVV